MTFGALELLAVEAIAMLACENRDTGTTVGLRLAFKNRLEVIDALVRLKVQDAALLADHESIIRDLTSISDKRNHIVHATWFDMPSTNIDAVKGHYKPKLKLHEGLKAKITNMTPAEITSLAVDTSKAYERFVLFLIKLVKAGHAKNHGGVIIP